MSNNNEPKQKDVIEDIKDKINKFENDEKHLEQTNKKNFLELREKWSKYIFWFIITSFVMQFILIFLLGFCNKFNSNFEKYKIFLNILVTEDFAQIIGLALLVVRFLFSKY
jgi:uncharacterized membrane protein (DUF485 family)